MGFSEWLTRVFGSETVEPATSEQLKSRLVRVNQTDISGGTSAGGLTPARWAAALIQADRGNITGLVQILRGIERRYPHLMGVLGTRRQALVGAGWEILAGEGPRAEEAAEEVTRQLGLIPDFDRVLLQLMEGVYQPLGIQEITWAIRGHKAEVADLAWVDPAKVRWITGQTGDDAEIGEMRLLATVAAPRGDPFVGDKFLIHQPPILTGYPWEAGLGRLLGWFYLFGIYGIKDWATYAELFAIPMRTFSVPDGTPDEERDVLEDILADMGTQAYGVFSEGVELTLHPPGTGTGGSVYGPLLEWVDRAVTKAVLGHAGSADSTSGKLGGETSADDIRQDLLAADAKALAATLQRDLFGPIVRFNLGEGVAIPKIVFDVAPAADTKDIAERIKIMVDTGLPVPMAWAYEVQGIPQPEGSEPVLERKEPAPGGGLPFG